MEGHIQEYFNEKALKLLGEAQAHLVKDLRPETHALLAETNDFINYMRCHGDTATKDLINEIWV